MTSIIRAISISNFKGFTDEVRVPLRPITLLFGANSAGKSSVMQSLQLMREVLERGSANIDRTVQGGDTIDLGGFQNFVHNHDISKPVSVRVEMDLGDELIPEFFEDAIEDRSEVDSSVWKFNETLDSIRDQVKTVAVQLTLSWSEIRSTAVVSGYRVDINEKWCTEVVTSPDGRQPRLRINAGHPIFIAAGIEGADLFEGVAEWAVPGGNSFLFRTEMGLETEKIEGQDLEPVPPSVILAILDVVRGSYANSPSRGFADWLQNFQGALPRLDKPILIPAERPETASNIFVLQEFSAFISWLLIGPAQLLREQLRKSRYLGPLRQIPPRDFDVALSKNEAAWSDGMAAWQILLEGPDSLVKSCSEWMASVDKLSTGYGIERTVVQEFDMSGPTPRPFGNGRRRLALTDISGIKHLPQDVGVGISQVLPVVVAAQDGTASFVCVEQPELHIHPAVQVGLGDLFIDGVINQGLSFLIETHSEHLVMRLQRRIREQVTGDLPMHALSLDLKDLTFVYLGRNSAGNVTATTIGLTPEGKFDSPWPNGFFSERANEVLTVAMRAKFQDAQRRG